ncbi:MAG: trypsin-like peptidase domain-containing protein [Gemmatimonadetes bacterium]|nr:trypsin-like peptidase domain-containing protein [Gemmatimonadota bacterium]
MRLRRSVAALGWILALAGVASAIVVNRRRDASPASPALEPAGWAAQAPAGRQPAAPPPRGAAAAAAQAEVDASRRTAIVLAANRVAAAVVSVNAVRREAVQPSSLWERFFVPPGYEREVTGLGSGFVIREDGLVLTNEHVVRAADRVVVTLADGREYEAEVLGTDEVTDLALLRVRGAGRGDAPLPLAPLGDSDDLVIGEWVLAIGNPFGYLLSNPEPTVTAGVVSGVGRNIIPAGEGDRGFYLDMIQTDASINPGNSGGPLVNALGEVVGVNSSIISKSGGSEGLGFAIPINRARRIAMDLLDDGRVRRAWVGMEVEATDANGGGRRRRVRIAHVAPGSPAAAAGLRAGMGLRAVAGRMVRTPLDWEARLLDAEVGQPLELTVGEDAEDRTVRVRPADLPSLTAERIRALADFELVTLTPAIRAERGLSAEQGALIVSLSGAARELGLRPGDLILQVNRQPIRTAEEAAALMRRLAGRGPVRVFFERRGQIGSTSFYVSG